MQETSGRHRADEGMTIHALITYLVRNPVTILLRMSAHMCFVMTAALADAVCFALACSHPRL